MSESADRMWSEHRELTNAYNAVFGSWVVAFVGWLLALIYPPAGLVVCIAGAVAMAFAIVWFVKCCGRVERARKAVDAETEEMRRRLDEG